MHLPAVALLVDHENIAIPGAMPPALDQSFLEGLLGPIGPLAVRLAYGRWDAYPADRSSLVDQGFDLVDVPAGSGPNHADLCMALDAQRLAIADGYRHFVIVTGDGDFVPLVRDLRREGARIDVVAPPGDASIELMRLADRHARLPEPGA